jgi:hypothetical protein
LHTLSYYTTIPFCNYLYTQHVSCATSTLGFVQVWLDGITISISNVSS